MKGLFLSDLRQNEEAALVLRRFKGAAMSAPEKL